MKTIKGDLVQLALDGEFDAIVHGCNCFHTMGAGIAKAIASEFPEALKADKETEFGDKSKLGTVSTCSIQRGRVSFSFVNAYTQFQWRGRGRKVDYDAIENCFDVIAERFPNARIGYPLIGAGLAGGDWSVIESRIRKSLVGHDHTLVVFDS